MMLNELYIFVVNWTICHFSSRCVVIVVGFKKAEIPKFEVSKRTNVDEAGDPAIEEKLAGQLDAKQTRPAWYQQSRAIFLSHLYQKQGSKKSFIFKTRDTKCKKSSKKETLTQEKLLHTTDVALVVNFLVYLCTVGLQSALFLSAWTHVASWGLLVSWFQLQWYLNCS